MRILLDENVPEPLTKPLVWLLHAHKLDLVGKRWKGIKDLQLYEKARRLRYDVLISNDSSQLLDADICKAIQRSGVHCVYFNIGSSSMDSLAAAAAALIYSIREITAKLEKAERQHVVVVDVLRGGKPYVAFDVDRVAPSPMWPRKQYGNHQPSREKGPRGRHPDAG